MQTTCRRRIQLESAVKEISTHDVHVFSRLVRRTWDHEEPAFHQTKNQQG